MNSYIPTSSIPTSALSQYSSAQAPPIGPQSLNASSQSSVEAGAGIKQRNDSLSSSKSDDSLKFAGIQPPVQPINSGTNVIGSLGTSVAPPSHLSNMGSALNNLEASSYPAASESASDYRLADSLKPDSYNASATKSGIRKFEIDSALPTVQNLFFQNDLPLSSPFASEITTPKVNSAPYSTTTDADVYINMEVDLNMDLEPSPLFDFMAIMPESLFVPDNSPISQPYLSRKTVTPNRVSKPVASAGPKLKGPLRCNTSDKVTPSIQLLNSSENTYLLFDRFRKQLARKRRSRNFKSENKKSDMFRIVGPLVDTTYYGRDFCMFAGCIEKVLGMQNTHEKLNHMLRKHCMMELHTCDICYMVLSRKDALLRHVNIYHPGVEQKNKVDTVDKIGTNVCVQVDVGRIKYLSLNDVEPWMLSRKWLQISGIRKKCFLPAIPSCDL